MAQESRKAESAPDTRTHTFGPGETVTIPKDLLSWEGTPVFHDEDDFPDGLFQKTRHAFSNMRRRVARDCTRLLWVRWWSCGRSLRQILNTTAERKLAMLRSLPQRAQVGAVRARLQTTAKREGLGERAGGAAGKVLAVAPS